MEGYLGETVVKKEDTEYKDYSKEDWAFYFIEAYGGIDGDHHKAWVLDQVVRVLKGTLIEIKLAKWKCGVEDYRINTLEPSQEYLDWVKEMCDGDEGPDTYDYDCGIAP